MEEYKSNSHRSKEVQKVLPTEKKIEKVVSGTVKSKKKSEIQKFADVFVSEDIDNVKSYILMDVLVPALKAAIIDAVTNGVNMIFYGEAGRPKKSASSRVSYGRYYDDKDYDRRNNRSNRTKNKCNYNDIIFDNRGDAEEVLSGMDDLMDRYGLVSVGDLYDLVGISGDYTDNKYGWTDIRSARVVRVRDSYMLKLPRALPLD